MNKEHPGNMMNLIIRCLTGSADKDEIIELNKWLESSPQNKDYYEQVRNIWDAADKTIDPEDIKIPEAYGKVLKRIPEFSEKKSLWFYWQKIAAIILIPLIIGGIFLFNVIAGKMETSDHVSYTSDEVQYNEVYTSTGTRSSMLLSDSTVVWLNSGSSLRFPIKFQKGDRKVYLKGEAYFEVKSDVTRPFIVETPVLQVRATGTTFSVADYELSAFKEVTLVSGKVSVNEIGNDKNPIASALVPDQHLSYNTETKQLKTIYGDTYKYISWKDGILMFRDDPLELILNKLSMFFDVDIEIRCENLKNNPYRATFKDEPLEEILKLLKFSAPINYAEVKREPLPDGSFPKRKVIVWEANN